MESFHSCRQGILKKEDGKNINYTRPVSQVTDGVSSTVVFDCMKVL